jgi:hypothetical protein
MMSVWLLNGTMYDAKEKGEVVYIGRTEATGWRVDWRRDIQNR